MKPILKRSIVVFLLAAILGLVVVDKWGSSSQTVYGDIDRNGNQEEYLLKNQQLQVFENNHLIWHTPGEWQVNQIRLADADNNEQTELLLVIWKKGSFGKSKPFWFKGPDDKYTCHLFLYRLLSGRMKEVWCSSALVNPIIKLDVKDTDADGLNELNVREGPQTGFAYPLRKLFSHQNTTWIWNGWGFTRKSWKQGDVLFASFTGS
ncbi:MAG: hypothetical protein ABFD08_14615 [Syntrophomonas sp.]